MIGLNKLESLPLALTHCVTDAITTYCRTVGGWLHVNSTEASEASAPLAAPSSPQLYVKHVLILNGGALLGLGAAYLLGGISFDFPDEIDHARQLGIVSKTILAGYPKSRDLLNYLFVLGLPVICALIPWLVWSRRNKKPLKNLLWESEFQPRPLRGSRNLYPFLLVVVAGLFITFNINMFYQPSFNPYVKAWILLGEEGEMLEWAQRVLNGEVYGKDYFCLYGPMLIYPLAWFLELFGETVAVARVYAHVLNVLGYGIAVVFLYKTARSRTSFVLYAILYLFVFNMISFVAPKSTPLRFLLGILPLLMIYLNSYSQSRAILMIAGVFAGQSLLFSQEAGICCVATVAFIALADLCVESDRRQVLRNGTLFTAGIVLSVSPFFAYLVLNGAVGSFFESIYGYPRLVMLGFGALPFPSFGDFVASPLTGGAFFNYWVICVYIVSLLSSVPSLLIGRMDRRTRLKLALAVFGIILFRVALARSAETNVLKVAHPAFLLCFLHIDGALQTIRFGSHFKVRMGAIIQAGAWIVSLFLLLTHSPFLRAKLTVESRELWEPSQKFRVAASGSAVPEVERLGVFVDKATAASLSDIQWFLSNRTRPRDFVYVFPNEPIYYFLFDRRNPTRFAMSYFAISREQRQELVKDLEEKRPRYIVYSPNTWRVDDIAEDVQVPEVVAYIRQSYHLLIELRDVVILQRNFN